MVIQHNMQAMNTNRQLGISVGAGAKSTEKLSSGYRINRAGDDAAGLAISEKMRSQIRGLDRASSNSQDGISLIQTAEGALNETQSILQRMRELSVQAANGTNTDSDRNEIQKEVNQLTSEINRIGNTTEFNTMKLLKGNTNKAEIGGVDSETLKEGETGVAGGSLENFKVEQTSTQAKDSSAKLIGNTAEATGSLKSDILDETVKGVQGEYSTTTVGGITFSSTEKSASGNGNEIIIKSISDVAADGTTANKEGIVKAGNKIYIALTESTINSVANAQELINRINNLGSGTTGGGAGNTDTALGIAGTAGIAGTTIAKQDLKLTLPKDEPTGNSVQAFLPQSAGKEVTGTLQGGKVETRGEYTLEIDKLFKEADDTITIAGEKFTSKNSGSDIPSAGDFSLGDSHAIVSFGLTGIGSGKTKIVLSGKIAGHDMSINLNSGATASDVLEAIKTKAEGFGASVLYDKDNGYITIVSKEKGSGATVSGFTGFATGAGGLTLSADAVRKAGIKASGNEKEAQNANLAAAIALNANIGKNYILGAAPGAGAITIKEKANQGGIGKELDRTLKVEGSGGEDNTITITNPKGMNGIEFEITQHLNGSGLEGVSGTGGAAGNSDGTLQITQSAAGSNKFYINLGTNTNANTAAKIQQALRDFVKAGTVNLADGSVADFSDLTVEAGGKWDDETTNVSNITKDWTATAGGVEEKAGTYSFDVTSLFKDGDQVNIAGKTFVAKSKNADLNKGEFDISSTDKATQALRLKEAVGANAEIAEKYDIKVNNNKITLIEKSASGKDMKETDVKVENLGTQGQFKVDELELQKDGASITIDGQKIDFTSKNAHVGYTNGTAIKVTDTVEDQKTALVAAINKNAELNKKYEASIGDDGSLMLTQKIGSDNAPEVTTTSSTKGTFDVTFQVGANTGQSMTIAIGDNRANALGVAGDGTEDSIMADNGATAYYTKVSNVTDGTTNDNVEFALDVTSFEKATAAIGVIDDALSSISAQRSQLGAYQNRLEHTIANLDNTSENLQASESRIRDVDMAKEMTNFSKNNILQQAAQSMLAQANQSTQGVLTLLR